MSKYAHHESLKLENFTAFAAAAFDFVPGINVFVGENGTGKTHVMKALYAMQLAQSRQTLSDGIRLQELFQTQNIKDIIHHGTGGTFASAHGIYNDIAWEYGVWRNAHALSWENYGEMPRPERPVFIPAIDMMGHTKGFTEAYEEVRLDFDLTCRDVVNLLRLERKNGSDKTTSGTDLEKLLDGSN